MPRAAILARHDPFRKTRSVQATQNGLTRDLEEDPSRWWGIGEVLRLSVPTVLTTVSFTLMQFVDGLMVARVSEEAMSAQLTGGMASFTAMCFFIGLLSCVSTFASQNLGAGSPDRGAVYAWQGGPYTGARCRRTGIRERDGGGPGRS
jgi:hypothetical protein